MTKNVSVFWQRKTYGRAFKTSIYVFREFFCGSLFQKMTIFQYFLYFEQNIIVLWQIIYGRVSKTSIYVSRETFWVVIKREHVHSDWAIFGGKITVLRENFPFRNTLRWKILMCEPRVRSGNRLPLKFEAIAKRWFCHALHWKLSKMRFDFSIFG